GPGIATRLGISQLTYVVKIRSIDLEKKEIVVERQLEGGREVLRAELPALLTVVKELNTAGTILQTSLIGHTDPVSFPLIDVGGTGVDARLQFALSTDTLVNNNKVGGVIGHKPIQIKFILNLQRTALHP
ncbi:electron transfer flavoprotein beta subunit, partial [Candidatus Hakubella thermalkaliphila]